VIGGCKVKEVRVKEVFKVSRGFRVFKVIEDYKVKEAFKEKEGFKVFKVREVNKGRRELLDLKAKKAKKAKKVIREVKVIKVIKVFVESQEQFLYTWTACCVL
jgi:hypothetical protein